MPVRLHLEPSLPPAKQRASGNPVARDASGDNVLTVAGDAQVTSGVPDCRNQCFVARFLPHASIRSGRQQSLGVPNRFPR